MLDCPIILTQRLIQIPSVTPEGKESLDLMESLLAPLGFVIHRLSFEGIETLYARLGIGHPHFCFAGHVDVVPAPFPEHWRFPPFEGKFHEGFVYGRGAVDMKGAIACFLTSLHKFLASCPLNGSISLLLTADEEGPAVHGTARAVRWLQARGERIDFCLVGEPTNPQQVGQVIKIGRRGSLNLHLSGFGKGGHVAYPQLAQNPIPLFLKGLSDLVKHSFDQGEEGFPPTHLEVTSVDVGNSTSNLIPSVIHAKVNIRFCPQQHAEALVQSVEKIMQDACRREINCTIQTIGTPAESFLCPPSPLLSLLQTAVEKVCGGPARLDTGGGTSDARFLKDLCPVVEFGLPHETAHQKDERIAVRDLFTLEEIYFRLLHSLFLLEGSPGEREKKG